MKCSCGAEMVLRSSKFSNDLFWGCSTFPRCRETRRFVEEEPTQLQLNLTPEQQVIKGHVKFRKGNLLIQAVAGSGKTTTILSALSVVPETARTIFLAFNKSIAKVLATRAPSHVEVRTLHSLGYNFISRRYPHIAVDEDKTMNIIVQLLGEDGARKDGILLDKMYGLLLCNVMSITRESVEELIDYHNLDIEMDLDSMVHILNRIATESRKLYEAGISISYDEEIYIPMMDKTLCRVFDYIFLDEIQDFNRMQTLFVLNCCDLNTIVTGVGDRAQSIYGFAGADLAAMDFLKQRLAATELPLSICFRCPSSHIALAQKFVPQIQAREGAPVGDIIDLDVLKFLDKVQVEDLVISRLNAPLLPLALNLIKQGKPAYVKGRDIGNSIITLLNKEKSKTVEAAAAHIVEVSNKKAEKLVAKNKLAQAAYVMDLCECALYFLEEGKTVAIAINSVNSIFKEEGKGIVLSTIHKAKGLEATRVFIIDYDRMPLKVNTHWEMQQEKNLMYVALTRSKQSLYFVKLPRS